ncbi:hypothetical protein BCR33DRAFT_720708 [Rhizoclosmatium globosum]|uniref:Zn(2)-C6 fungal-type domain-containing protein n=1 Tax=Rhizoclosmatium globosum TaxID=329046 RepID=A0A1Y2BUC8_9FUNG|nr:hypothetical protein BCR33DRAFT_720708 [Rhizoclosmatium globosum]|eukprot:ORY38343.1 hypothetical protein BCR33DRAFT_720708 [Rhizoclosmatium globosum]
MKATSCEHCRKSKKGCTRELGGCSGCRTRGIPCIYPEQTVRAIGAFKGPPFCILSPNIGTNQIADDINSWNTPVWESIGNEGSPLKQIIKAMEAPMIFDVHHDEWILQDPDLMPTWRDFECVHTFFTMMSGGPRAGGMMDSFDTSNFLLTFFQQPPSFRLVITAIAAYYLGANASEESYLLFFKRARKAVILAANKPSVSNARAYYWIFVCSKIMSKKELGLPFLIMAVDMLKTLQLDIDPDDLPWLCGLQLTEIEIEERRRLYWNVKQILEIERSLSLELGLPELSFGYVKPMRPIPGTFRAVDSLQLFCKIRESIVSIKEHHLCAPKSCRDLLFSAAEVNLHLQLISTQSEIPNDYLLMKGIDFERVERLYNPVTALYLVWMNFDLYAAVVMLHRSKLYLSALDCCVPSRLNSSTHEIITLAIKETLNATQNMINCVSLLANLTEERRRGITMNMLLLYPIFEAAISAWFLTCRMNEQWRSLVPIPVEDLQNGVAQFLNLGQNTKEGKSGPILPIMKAMLQEMTGIQDQTQWIDSHGISNMTNAVEEPLAFMGLLGLEVKGGLRWQGKKEENWRGFWTENRRITDI